MSLFARVLHALPLAGAILLASCGGGGGGATPANQQAPDVIKVVDPVPTPTPDVPKFIALAQQADCADRSNRLYIIDQKYAFMARTGNCADASYAYQLFGATPELLLCTKADSIAGPRTTCSDDKAKAIFDIIVANLDKADLGLGITHKVEPIAIPPKDGSTVAFDSIATDSFSSIHAARKVVVKDVAAFAALWAEHTAGRTPAAPPPMVDFSKQMVLAAFAGDSGGCREYAIRRITTNAGKLVVEVADRDINPVVLCKTAVTAPMQMVVVARSDASVEFTTARDDSVAYTAIEGGRTAMNSASNHVIKDAAAWTALWSVHRPDAPVPAIDFGKQMVLAVFLGTRSNGCYGVGLDGIVRAAGKLKVSVVEYLPGPTMVCTQALVSPSLMVALARSDEPVEFLTTLRAQP